MDLQPTLKGFKERTKRFSFGIILELGKELLYSHSETPNY
jgi:hypothetical protein